MLTISVITLFPKFFTEPLATSILGRAHQQGLVTYTLVPLRSFATDKHHITDDRPFGGGPGMVLKVEPIDKALNSLALPTTMGRSRKVLLSAKGKLFNQAIA